LSDGDFKYTTLENWTKEFSKAYDFFKYKTGVKSIYVVGHSLGSCVIGKYLEQNPDSIDKAVLISPALNQKDLMRYWFVSEKMKKENPELIIDWNNYKKFFDEDKFQKDVKRTDKLSKYNFISSEYFQECSQLDLSNSFEKYKNKFLQIQGENDSTMPIESLNIDFTHKFIVKGGDHDMERPNQRTQWIDKVIKYLVD
jgi:esterase/lipase